MREAVEREHGELHLLRQQRRRLAGAGASPTPAGPTWSATCRLNFEAPVRLTEALLPLLRATAAAAPRGRRGPRAVVSIVNVASTAGRVARPGAGRLLGGASSRWPGGRDALHLEEREHGVHVGLVLPGFVKTEGFPAAELLARPATRWIVSTPEAVAEAIVEAGPGGRPERYVPRFYWIVAALRVLAPRLVRRATGGGAFTTTTGHN